MKKIILLPLLFLLVTLFLPQSIFADSECTPGTPQCVLVTCDNPSYSAHCQQGKVCKIVDFAGTRSCEAPDVNEPLPEEAVGAVGEIIPPGQIDPTSSALTNYLPTLWQAALYFGLLLAFIYLIYGAIKWILAGGDQKALMGARNTMTHAVVGTVLLSCALVVATIVNSFVGNSQGTVAKGPVDIRICGWGRSNISEIRALCQEPDAVPDMSADAWNALTPAQKSQLCVGPSACDYGCVQNDRLVPKDWKYCRRPGDLR